MTRYITATKYPTCNARAARVAKITEYKTDQVAMKAKARRSISAHAENTKNRGKYMCLPSDPYSTVTDFARLRGWSTSVPMAAAVK